MYPKSSEIKQRDGREARLDFPAGALIGFFLGFAFGVGCALAVMYSIYMSGYRAAVREMRASVPTERLLQEVAKAERVGSKRE
jgi:uncharacterized membrane protein YfcA